MQSIQLNYNKTCIGIRTFTAEFSSGITRNILRTRMELIFSSLFPDALPRLRIALQ